MTSWKEKALAVVIDDAPMVYPPEPGVATRLRAELLQAVSALTRRRDDCVHPWRNKERGCRWWGWEYGVERRPGVRNVRGGCEGGPVGACCACLCGNEGPE